MSTMAVGTFKFERNVQYRESMDKFEQEQILRFQKTDKYRATKNAGAPEAMLKNMAHSFIEEKKKELKPQLKFIKTFVPIFPWAYQNLSDPKALGDQYSMSLYGKKEMPANLENEKETLHKLAQIKFSIRGNRLLNYEETREKQKALQLAERRTFTDYLLELDFENIKTVWICRDQR